MSETKTYTEDDLRGLTKDGLEQIVSERDIAVEGTGANGNVLNDDMVAAILAAQDPEAAVAAEGEGAPAEGALVESDIAGTGKATQASDDTSGLAPARQITTGKREIARTNFKGDWWCPFCDHALESKLTACTKCGAVKKDDTAVRR